MLLALTLGLASVWYMHGRSMAAVAASLPLPKSVAPTNGEFSEMAARSKNSASKIELRGHRELDSFVEFVADQSTSRSTQLVVSKGKLDTVVLAPGRYRVSVAYMRPNTIRVESSMSVPFVLSAGSTPALIDLNQGRVTRVPFPVRGSENN